MRNSIFCVLDLSSYAFEGAQNGFILRSFRSSHVYAALRGTDYANLAQVGDVWPDFVTAQVEIRQEYTYQARLHRIQCTSHFYSRSSNSPVRKYNDTKQPHLVAVV
jgi:hypothetical protein